jgi:hypothetical protein
MFVFFPGFRISALLPACRTHLSAVIGTGGGLLASLAMLAPAGRGRRRTVKLPLESSHPEAARALRQMQRDHRTRLLSAVVGDGSDERAIALEDGVEGNLLVHVIAAAGSLTLAAGWLGSGRRRYIWVPLRPTLAWNAQTTDAAPVALSLLTAEQIAALALDLHTGFTQLDQRHVIEEFLTPDPIPREERQAVLDRYTQLLASHGWEVSLDASQSRRSLRRTDMAQDTAAWPQADREELARLEALVAQVLQGVRASSRILYQVK